MYEPLVSIITPVYNAEQFLPELIQTVLKQTYVNWEWIMVDDGSTDNSYGVLKEAASKDTRIKVHRNENNLKVFQARNNALATARGEFIAFLDADDLWEPDKLRLQLDFMQEKNSWFTYTDFDRFVNDPEKPLRMEKLPDIATYKKILTNNYIATSSVIIWRSRIGDFRMRDIYHEDFVLWLALLKKIEFAKRVPVNLMHYRLSKGSLSRNKFKSAKEVYVIFTRKMGFGYIKGIRYFIAWAFNTTLRYMK